LTVGPITVGTLRYAGQTAIETDEYGSAYQVNQAFGAPVRTASGGERVALDERWAPVYRPDRPTTIVGWEQPATMLGVKIDRLAYERFHASFAGVGVGDAVPFGLRLDTSTDAGREWTRAVRRLVRWADGGRVIAPGVRELLVEGCMAALACAAEHPRAAALRL
ncbi:AraC-like ligand-binding domain-containing protein, partial [Burkholderia cenocepacia]|uniref:AraC-like ligand-binding domain-containing protein n=1 Tax=Burkholderia cenocepacia TaxID=95486 RepID=UPI0038CBF866